MMKYKFEIVNFKVQEKEQFEAHLNEMSEKGWNLRWFNEYVICYVKSNDRKYYYIDFNQNVKMNAHRFIDENQQKQIDLYADMGYEYVSCYKCFMVYSSTERLSKLHTDDEVEKLVIDKAKKSYMFFNVIIPIFAIIIIFGLYLGNRATLISVLLNNALITLVILTILFALFLIVYTSYSGKKSKENTIGQIKTRSYIFILSYAMLFLLILASMYQISSNKILMVRFLMLLGVVIIFRFIFTNVLSKQSSLLKGILIVFIFIFYIISYSYISMRNDVYLEEEKQTENLLSKDTIGEYTKISYYRGDESVLLKMIECDFTFKDEDVYFDYIYFQDKTNMLNSLIMDELQRFHTEGYSYSIGDVDVYNEDESLEMFETEEENLEWAPFIILRKENEYIAIMSSEKLSDDKIEMIVEELQW